MSRILVIDDDEFFCKLMVHALTQQGHEVDHAPNGLKGAEKFSNTAYDAVVCDIVMPEQEGVETIRAMRRQRPDIAIVAISGGLARGAGRALDVLVIAERLGADTTLSKPFQLSALVTTVESAIASRQSRAPHAARL
jgi:CheY-like chemotaxis protein